MRKVFVTGSSGFIGRYVTKALLKEGYDVTGLTRTAAKANLVRDMGADAVIGDINRKETFEDALKGTDFVIHLAGAHVAADPEQFHRTDYVGTKNLLEACVKGSVQRLIFASAVEVYGGTHGQAAATEFTPPRPNHALGRAKLAAEELLLKASRDHGLPVVILRSATVYGIGGLLVDNLVQMAWGQKSAYPKTLPLFLPSPEKVPVSFVHVKDAARAFLLALGEKSKANIYNISDDQPANWDSFLRPFFHRGGAKKMVMRVPVPGVLAVAKAVEIRDRITGHPPLFTYQVARLLMTPRACSNQKVKAGLGFVPQFPSIREGTTEILEHLTGSLPSGSGAA